MTNTTVSNKWTVQSNKIISYQVTECEGLFLSESQLLLQTRLSNRRLVILDQNLVPPYAEIIKAYFKRHNYDIKIIAVSTGEARKNLLAFQQIIQEFDKFNLHRRCEPVIIIGGGVLTDLVGFATSCYRRGVPCIKIPTTLMGYIDAAIGIKTGINLYGNKNRLGSFAAPMDVILDKTFLKTLPKRHIVNGIGEIFKMAVIKNADLFESLEKEGKTAINDRFQQHGHAILTQSVQSMLEELEPNLFEDNLNRIVDFGHTFSLALEMPEENDLLHGEAVAIDIAFSCFLAQVLGMIQQEEASRILALQIKLGLPIFHDSMTPQLLWEGLQERTVHRDGKQRLPLPTAIGESRFINTITLSNIKTAYSALHAYSAFLNKSGIAKNQNVIAQGQLQNEARNTY